MLFPIETVDITKTLHSLHTLSTFEPTLDSDIEINTNKKQTIAWIPVDEKSIWPRFSQFHIFSEQNHNFWYFSKP